RCVIKINQPPGCVCRYQRQQCGSFPVIRQVADQDAAKGIATVEIVPAGRVAGSIDHCCVRGDYALRVVIMQTGIVKWDASRIAVVLIKSSLVHAVENRADKADPIKKFRKFQRYIIGGQSESEAVGHPGFQMLKGWAGRPDGGSNSHDSYGYCATDAANLAAQQ